MQSTLCGYFASLYMVSPGQSMSEPGLTRIVSLSMASTENKG